MGRHFIQSRACLAVQGLEQGIVKELEELRRFFLEVPEELLVRILPECRGDAKGEESCTSGASLVQRKDWAVLEKGAGQGGS